MLMESSVDPFDAQEAKPYKNDPQVTLFTVTLKSLVPILTLCLSEFN